MIVLRHLAHTHDILQFSEVYIMHPQEVREYLEACEGERDAAVSTDLARYLLPNRETGAFLTLSASYRGTFL